VKRLLRSPVFNFFLFALLLLGVAFLLDAEVRDFMARHQTPSGKNFMLHVSRWGDWPTHVVIGLLGVLVCWLRGKREWMMIFAAMLLALALIGAVNPVIKAATGRARPSVKTDVGWKGPSLHQKYHAFPSGHTVATSAFFAALFLARRRIGFALLPIPVLIAVSRLYLNAHYFSDVVFGAILGIACALLAWWLIGRWRPNEVSRSG
jgi:membrane-associated phospholipid phosphatase